MNPAIPVVDFSRFLDGAMQDRQQTAGEIDNALRTVGFFYLLNHGIDQGKLDTCFEWNRGFSNLAQPEKDKLRPAPQSFEQGYFGLQKEKVHGQACIKESFSFGDPRDNGRCSWPKEEQLSGFRADVADFYQDCAGLTDKLLECLSIALDLGPEDALNQYHTGSLFVSSLIHYPAVSARLLRSGEVVRNPAHSDFGTLTLLFQRDVGGLEIADMSSTDKTTTAAVERSAKFIHVDPKPGTVLVNTGYLLMRWTNGRWKNTVHRVSEPPAIFSNKAAQGMHDLEETIPQRYSIAFFSFPDPATIVEPLPTCFSDQEQKRWGPINAGEYLLKKRTVMYSQSEAAL